MNTFDFAKVTTLGIIVIGLLGFVIFLIRSINTFIKLFFNFF